MVAAQTHYPEQPKSKLLSAVAAAREQSTPHLNGVEGPWWQPKPTSLNNLSPIYLVRWPLPGRNGSLILAMWKGFGGCSKTTSLDNQSPSGAVAAARVQPIHTFTVLMGNGGSPNPPA